MSIFGFSVFRKDKTTLIQSPLGYVGDVDASNSGSLPVGATSGETYRVSVTGGTKNFNGTWDANCEPLYIGATFEVGDYIVYNDAGLWEKIDASDIQIVDNLVSTDADKALSANQGKILQDTKADIVAGAGGTHTKITYNTQGIVTAGTDANASDVINDSSITGATVKEALDTIDSTFALDSEVVHLAGAEVITGDKEFQGTNSYTSLTASTTLELDASNNMIGATKNTAYNKNFGTSAGDVAGIDAGGLGNSEVVLTNASGELITEAENTAHNKSFGFNNGDVPNIETGLDLESVVLTNINKNLVTETKNTAHNKNFGINPGDVAEIGTALLPSSNVTTDATGKLVTTGGTETGYDPGHFKGLKFENDIVSPDSVIKIYSGSAKSFDNTTDILLVDAIKKDISTTWASGSGNGGRAGGAGVDIDLTLDELLKEDYTTQTRRMIDAQYLDSGNTLFGYQFTGYTSTMVFNTTMLSLTTPYDLSDVTYEYNTRTTISATLPSTTYMYGNCALFNSLGDKLYLIGSETNAAFFTTLVLIELDLATPFDTRTITQGSAINLSSVLGIATSAYEISAARFGNSGNKLYLCNSSGIIYELDLSTPFDALTASYSGSTIDISGTVANPNDMRIKDDGSKVLFLDYGGAGNDLFEYNFGTNWDITSITLVQSADLSTVPDYVQNTMLINPTGDELYATDLDGFVYYLYDITTAWNISSLSYSSNSYNLLEDFFEDIGPINFSEDGKQCMFIPGDQSKVNIYSAKLEDPFDLSTIIPGSLKYFEYTPWYSWNVTPSNKAFCTTDGEHIYVLYYGEVAEFSASTPWDASTITDTTRRLTVHSGLPTSTPNYHGLAISKDGTKLLAIANDTGSTDEAYYYTLGTAFNLSTADSPSALGYGTLGGVIYQASFSENGEAFYLGYTSFFNRYIARWDLSAAYDISNVSSAATDSAITDSYFCFYLDNLETNLYINYSSGTDQGVTKKYKTIPSDTSLQSNFTYFIHLIKNTTTGEVDIGFDSEPNAYNLLSESGYDKYRMICPIITDSSGDIVSMVNEGKKFLFTTGKLSQNTIAPTLTLYETTVPNKIKVNGIYYAEFLANASTATAINGCEADTNNDYTLDWATADASGDEHFSFLTNKKSQIKLRYAGGAPAVYGLYTKGWELIREDY